MITFMSTLKRISQTTSDAVTVLRILCFCDFENISVNILKEKCDVLNQNERSDILVVSTINELETTIDQFRSSVRLFKAIQKIQRLYLTICISKKFERTISILDVNHLDTLSSFAAFIEWQIQELESSFFATNNMTFIKEKLARSNKASNHAIHSESRKKEFWTTLRLNFRSWEINLLFTLTSQRYTVA